MGGGPVAQRAAGAGDQERGHEPAAQRHRVMPDRVHPLVHPAQPPELQPVSDLPAIEAKRRELPPPNHPALAVRQRRDRLIRRAIVA